MECPAGLYFDPALNVCNWPEEVDCVAKCSVQLVFADIQNQKLITWSPEENCQVEQFKGFPSLQSAIPETIHQCSNGLTVIKSQGLDITQLFAYNRTLEQWELIVMPAEISDVNSYAIAAIPDVPPSFGFGLLLIGGKVDVPFFSALDIICGFNCSAYDSNRNVDGAAWTCFPQTLCTPTYDSCATSSNDFVTVVNGKNPSPVKEVGFYPAMGLPPTCVSNAVDFDDGVQDCISLQPTGPTEVYAIGTGTKKFYQMNPGEGSVKLLDIPLPVIPTQEIPARMYFDPETSTLNIIGGTIDGIIPSCIITSMNITCGMPIQVNELPVRLA